MTNRINRRRRHKGHKSRNKWRGLRRRSGMDDSTADSLTLIELMSAALDRIPPMQGRMIVRIPPCQRCGKGVTTCACPPLPCP